jgi:DNA polymerase/3'-5' exonuclease PolX
MEPDTRAAPASGAGNAPGQRVWAYRKAAWAIEDLEQDVGLIYRQLGRKGLESIENVGPRLAAVIEALVTSGRPDRRTAEGQVS